MKLIRIRTTYGTSNTAVVLKGMWGMFSSTAKLVLTLRRGHLRTVVANPVVAIFRATAALPVARGCTLNALRVFVTRVIRSIISVTGNPELSSREKSQELHPSNLTANARATLPATSFSQ